HHTPLYHQPLLTSLSRSSANPRTGYSYLSTAIVQVLPSRHERDQRSRHRQEHQAKGERKVTPKSAQESLSTSEPPRRETILQRRLTPASMAMRSQDQQFRLPLGRIPLFFHRDGAEHGQRQWHQLFRRVTPA